ncbi:urease accessory protein UreD [Microvirga pudoricolor]|uniref:urease accessory protein UreD n=1 Tax=Microvirga pudoricolor TaxID=2778729 RepID=UPI00194EC04F|nr:urease accessory protein UreD [Microvirga pudoricolor]MBM6593302.1 urease accessory protein UreD [Microvirga pudoricolor]
MYVSAWPSDGLARTTSLTRQRAIGRVAFSAQYFSGYTKPGRISESGSMRVRMPRHDGKGLEAVLVNTAGGIACGDHFSIAVAAGPDAFVTVATPAAEKVYRSDGPVAEVSVDLTLGPGSRMDWMPQETLLFDQARLARKLCAAMPDDASLSVFEAVVFGRAARREVITDGLFEDRWRIQRGGRLIYADTLKLSGPISELLARPSVAGGRHALATFLHVAPDAEARLEEARQYLVSTDECEAAASAWNGMLAVRFCAAGVEALRRSACPFLVSFRHAPLPRVWLS